ncbi:MAG: phage tail assembly chaperone [Burkholderiaceae bacterium]
MRATRNQLLAASDWTQVADAPVDRAAWATYRQQLRDAPATWTPGPTWDAPDPPA